MEKRALTEKIKQHLEVLCSEIGERRVGSEQNRRATAYAQKVLEESGWQTEATKLSVIDWKTEGATLTCDGQSFEVFSSHYSLGCRVHGELIAVDSISRLEQTDIEGKIVLLYGEIATQQTPFLFGTRKNISILSLRWNKVNQKPSSVQQNAIRPRRAGVIHSLYLKTAISIYHRFT